MPPEDWGCRLDSVSPPVEAGRVAQNPCCPLNRSPGSVSTVAISHGRAHPRARAEPTITGPVLSAELSPPWGRELEFPVRHDISFSDSAQSLECPRLRGESHNSSPSLGGNAS